MITLTKEQAEHAQLILWRHFSSWGGGKDSFKVAREIGRQLGRSCDELNSGFRPSTDPEWAKAENYPPKP